MDARGSGRRRRQRRDLAGPASNARPGRPAFHRAALANARHRAATMETLISVGASAAFLWSLYALFFTGAGRARLLPAPRYMTWMLSISMISP